MFNEPIQVKDCRFFQWGLTKLFYTSDWWWILLICFQASWKHPQLANWKREIREKAFLKIIISSCLTYILMQSTIAYKFILSSFVGEYKWLWVDIKSSSKTGPFRFTNLLLDTPPSDEERICPSKCQSGVSHPDLDSVLYIQQF